MERADEHIPVVADADIGLCERLLGLEDGLREVDSHDPGAVRSHTAHWDVLGEDHDAAKNTADSAHSAGGSSAGEPGDLVVVDVAAERNIAAGLGTAHRLVDVALRSNSVEAQKRAVAVVREGSLALQVQQTVVC